MSYSPLQKFKTNPDFAHIWNIFVFSTLNERVEKFLVDYIIPWFYQVVLSTSYPFTVGYEDCEWTLVVENNRQK